jgi:2,3-dihydroxy-p-cumate/2,3-dihydroxybenzoate 3,4-dioxygenase
MTRGSDRVVTTLGYVAVGTNDLDRAAEFYTDNVMLTVTTRRDDAVFLTGGVEHHWVRFDLADQPGVKRVAYQVRDDDAMNEIKTRLDRHGVPWKDGSDLANDRVDRYVRFTSPEGMEIELYHQMVEMPTPRPASPVGLKKMLHAVWLVNDAPEAARFYHEVLDFDVSDWIEQRTAFMRCGDGYHHSLAVLESEDAGKFAHFCMLVGSMDDVMRARFNAVRNGAEIGMEIMRHAPSGSVGVYISDPMHGFTVEFAAEHRRILPDEESTYRPRILPRIPETSDMWKAVRR